MVAHVARVDDLADAIERSPQLLRTMSPVIGVLARPPQCFTGRTWAELDLIPDAVGVGNDADAHLGNALQRRLSIDVELTCTVGSCTRAVCWRILAFALFPSQATTPVQATTAM